MPYPRKPRRKCKNCQTLVKRSMYFYCNLACLREYQYKQFIEKWLHREVSGTRIGGISSHVRRYLFRIYGEQCSLCGWNKRNPKTLKVPLEVDHIDGDYKNSYLENLRLICPNCHALTPTFRGLNKGKGRKYRVTNAPLA
jgi:hypothetical protein